MLGLFFILLPIIILSVALIKRLELKYWLGLYIIYATAFIYFTMINPIITDGFFGLIIMFIFLVCISLNLFIYIGRKKINKQ
ncbi:hypothetical protein [Eggerthia catenaformis]|uniref:hypothetical protein n=1 Tax=Eggerthia catenaformis TaxID=31973 RepID=UPI00248D4A6F|nr:hypothetical protein [Eggerthia catenaformis]